MSAEAVSHDEHHEEHVEFLEALNPPPSYWPILLALTVGLMPIGTVMLLFGEGLLFQAGIALTATGFIAALIPLMGWCHSVIIDKWEGHFGVIAQGNDLALGTKLFFLSEIAIFGSLFAYQYVNQYQLVQAGEWPPIGTPKHPHLALPAMGLIVLIISSVTCHYAHHAMMHGHRGACKNWMLATIGLGLGFLALQGYEYGLFIVNDFNPLTNSFSTVFFALTGFHGFHVMTGLIMLLIVYARLEIGHYHKDRHFSMVAASWYWHLVDVVWIVVFTTVYCMW